MRVGTGRWATARRPLTRVFPSVRRGELESEGGLASRASSSHLRGRASHTICPAAAPLLLPTGFKDDLKDYTHDQIVEAHARIFEDLPEAFQTDLKNPCW